MNKLKEYFAGSYTIRIILGALFGAIVADGFVTNFLIHNGLAKEANPFMQYWILEGKLLPLKIFGGLLAVVYLWVIYRRHHKLSICVSSMCLAAYTFIVFWNLSVLFRL